MEGLDLLKCTECPLGSEKGPTPRQVIPPIEWIQLQTRGKQSYEKQEADVLFVGMNPAVEEMAKKKFFVGESGRLLRPILDQLGYTDYKFSNVLLCASPSDVSESEINRASYYCKDRLFKEIEVYKPRLVVALGNLPLKTLLGRDCKIKSEEGKIFEEDNYAILATLHPAAILRNTELYRDFIEDLKVGVRYLNGTWRQITLNPKTFIIDSEQELEELCRRIDKSNEVVVDLETTGLGFYPYGREPDGIRCAVISFDAESAYIVPGLSSPYYEQHVDWVDNDKLREALNKPCIFHNGQFDCGFLWQKGYKTTIGYDTFLAYYMMDERTYAQGLKILGRRLLGAPEWEDELAQYLPNKKSSYDLVPDDVLYKYAAFDTISTYLLKKKFETSVNEGLYSDLIIPCSNMFVDLRHEGISIDFNSLRNVHKALQEELEERELELHQMTGTMMNPSSPKDVAEYLFDTVKLTPHRKFGRSTSQDALKNLGGHPVAEKVIEYREVVKLKSTYIYSLAGFLDLDIKIHPILKLFASVTGRLGASDPSVLNVIKNKDVRSLYKPPKGKLFLDADQKQMELRWYCIVTGDDYLKELLLSGDPHGTISDKILELTGKVWERDKVKTGVFGGIYLRGIESYMASFRIDKASAVDLRDTIYSMVPSLQRYHADIKEEITTTGSIETFFGRKRRFGLLTKNSFHDNWRMAVNAKIQSPASDTNLYCMLHLYRNGSRLGCRPIFPVHDSILFSIEDESCAIPVQREMEEFSTNLVEGRMPFTVESKVGPDWGHCVKICHECGRKLEGNLQDTKVKGVSWCSECASK